MSHSTTTPRINRQRRRLLGALGTGAALSQPWLAPLAQARTLAVAPIGEPRTLEIHNAHTGEVVETTYWDGRRYRPHALAELDRLLRDHRTGEHCKIDTRLIELLHGLRQEAGPGKRLFVVSAYRSPQTNEALVEQETGAVVDSLHLKGKAVDIYMPEVRLSRLHQAALAMRAGGVGYYPKSHFLHLDTGRVRHW